jgi:glutathione S-transferase
VPALRLPDGTVLVENVAIIAYVARTHPASGLLPNDPGQEAQALSLMAFFASAVHPAFAHWYAPQRFTADPAGEAGVKARGLEMFLGFCRDLDARLAGREWLLDAWSAADGYAFVFWRWGRRAGLPMTDLMHLAAHKDRMLARPAVRRVLSREGIEIA